MTFSEQMPDVLSEFPSTSAFVNVLDELQKYKIETISEALRVNNYAVLTDKKWILKHLSDYGITDIPYDYPIEILGTILLNVGVLNSYRGSKKGIELWASALSLGEVNINGLDFANKSSLLKIDDTKQSFLTGTYTQIRYERPCDFIDALYVSDGAYKTPEEHTEETTNTEWHNTNDINFVDSPVFLSTNSNNFTWIGFHSINPSLSQQDIFDYGYLQFMADEADNYKLCRVRLSTVKTTFASPYTYNSETGIGGGIRMVPVSIDRIREEIPIPDAAWILCGVYIPREKVSVGEDYYPVEVHDVNASLNIDKCFYPCSGIDDINPLRTYRISIKSCYHSAAIEAYIRKTLNELLLPFGRFEITINFTEAEQPYYHELLNPYFV